MPEPGNWKSLPVPAVGSRWAPIDGAGRGPRAARVMGVVEHYVVARFIGAIPFLLHLSEWHRKFRERRDGQ